MKMWKGILVTVILIVFSSGIVAQTSKKKVLMAIDLPQFSYPAPTDLKTLLTDETLYRAVADKVRADLEGILRDYDVEDKATLINIYQTLAYLDLQDGKDDSVIERIRLIRGLETKPKLKLFPTDFFEIEAIVKAQKETGQTSGTKFNEAFEHILTESFNRLPDSFFDEIKNFREDADYLDNTLSSFFLAQVGPKAKLNGNRLTSELAKLLIQMVATERFLSPLAEVMKQSSDAYLATHKAPAKINIWSGRNVTLGTQVKLTPVVVAICDIGVDPTVFPGLMFVNTRERSNGKDNDGNGFPSDVYGIGFDVDEQYTAEPLFRPYDADLKRFPLLLNERKLDEQLRDGIDNEETRTYKLKLKSRTPESGQEIVRLSIIFSTYSHGTNVAGIAAAGNPAARIMNARVTWRDQSGQPNTSPEDVAWARRFSANIKQFVRYFKKNKVRVVNMSWHMTRPGIEENLVKMRPELNAQQRRSEAIESFHILKTAMVEAFNSAPEILFVSGAGNDSVDVGSYEGVPASLVAANLIIVGAADTSGAAATFTSFGETVNLYAQGVDVQTYAPGGEIVSFRGTSAAAPQVSNLAAKLWALSPKLTVAEVIKLIDDGADINEADKRLKLINSKRSVALLSQRAGH